MDANKTCICGAKKRGIIFIMLKVFLRMAQIVNNVMFRIDHDDRWWNKEKKALQRDYRKNFYELDFFEASSEQNWLSLFFVI